MTIETPKCLLLLNMLSVMLNGSIRIHKKIFHGSVKTWSLILNISINFNFFDIAMQYLCMSKSSPQIEITLYIIEIQSVLQEKNYERT